MAGRVNDMSGSYTKTTESEIHDTETTTRDSFGFPNIVHDEPSQEDALADGIAYSDAKYGGKFKSNKGRKVIDKDVSGRSFEAEGFADEGSEAYQGCWALDHVIIVNTAHLPGKMEDSFDPVDPGDWLMFPGAQFKVSVCFLGNLHELTVFPVKKVLYS